MRQILSGHRSHCVRLVNSVTALLSHSSMNANSPASCIQLLVSIIYTISGTLSNTLSEALHII